MERLRTVLLPDGESIRVWLGAGVATGITLTQVNTVLTTGILVGTFIYTWRKALARRRRDREED